MRTEHQKPPWRNFGEFFNPFHSQPKELRPNRRIPPVHIPGDQAFLCLSCRAVHTTSRCSACDKGPSVRLEKWLKRPEGNRIVIMEEEH